MAGFLAGAAAWARGALRDEDEREDVDLEGVRDLDELDGELLRVLLATVVRLRDELELDVRFGFFDELEDPDEATIFFFGSTSPRTSRGVYLAISARLVASAEPP